MDCVILLFFSYVYVCSQRSKGALYESLVLQVYVSHLIWMLRSELGPLIGQ